MEKDCIQDCQQTPSCTPQPEPFVKLWCLTYKIKDEPDYEGMAVVAAIDVRQAIQVFTKESQHNGSPEKIRIGRIDQVPYPVVPKLITENYVRIFEDAIS